MDQTTSVKDKSAPNWILAVFPLIILVALIAFFTLLNPLSFFSGSFPPLEELTIQRVTFPQQGMIQVDVINGAPEPVTIAQVLVDDAYWQFTIEPQGPVSRLQQATIHLSYPWVDGEPLSLVLLTATGATFGADIAVALPAPQAGAASFFAYGLLGIYVGVIPVALGLLWFPFLRRISQKWINSFLALTAGLLLFLFVDTLLEAVEISDQLPGALQGLPLIVFGTLFSLGILLAISQRRGGGEPIAIASFIALGIGLHNFGEGLAIGAAFASGAAALGSFLVVGFTLHNITEGIAIAAPLTAEEQRPKLIMFVGLAILAGAPAMLGTWIGGFAYNPLLAVLFLSLGAGAILQVIWEVSRFLWKGARRQGTSAVSWLNFAGLTAGILIMYLTAIWVKF